MGDRGNIAVKQWDGDAVFLYTHWGGSEIGSVLQTALRKHWRWDDPAYLTRIVFDVLTAGETGSETGYGISTSPPDNEHPILTVDTKAQTVSAEGIKSWTFEEFIALEDANEAVNDKDYD